MEKYKITKTIRFKLEGINVPNINNLLSQGTNNFQLSSFISNLNYYLSDLKKFLFYKKVGKENEEYYIIKNNLTIKKQWLRQYAKQEFANTRGQDTKQKNKVEYRIYDFPSLSDKIQLAFDEAIDLFRELRNDEILGLNERARKAKTGLLLKGLNKRNTLSLLISLVENTLDKNEEDNLSIRLKNQGLKIKAELLKGIEGFLPDQSSGLPITKASFNYYTINKNETDFDNKARQLTSDLKIDISNGGLEKINTYSDIRKNKNVSYLNYTTSNKLKSEINLLSNSNLVLLGDSPILDINNYISLRQVLKNIKAEQKRNFNELMTQKSFTHEQLNNKDELYLFNKINENEFEEYKKSTIDIEKKATKLNECADVGRKKKLRHELQDLRKKRGELINATVKENKDKFKDYKAFANFYRSVAQKHGRILAQLKGIEKERVESQLLEYWAFIFEHKDKYELALIPKANAVDFRIWIEENQATYLQYENKLFWFESFTLRSLRKLCFGHIENKTGTNTFYPEIEKELGKKYFDKNRKFIKGEFDLADDYVKIQFYKDVLTTEYAEKVLNIPFELINQEIIRQTFADLDEFQIALEKICYQRFIICPDNIEQKLDEYNAQLFLITSIDLRSEEKSNYKTHTSIWKNFWSTENENNNFDIRLNPEITITYRKPKQSRLDKYGKGAELYDPKKKNRYLYPQFTLISTFSKNSNTPTKDLSFTTDKDFEASILDFNKKLKNEQVKFTFGIDNGETELSSLGVFHPDFNQETYNKTIEKLQSVEVYGFKSLTIKDLSYTEYDYKGDKRKLIQNPSYFLDKEIYMRTFNKTDEEYIQMFKNIFEENDLLTLDLTSAKMINSYLITNGDIPTHFKLQLKKAQKIVHSLNDHSQKETIEKIIGFEIKETTTSSGKTYVNINAKFKNGEHKSVINIRPEFQHILSNIETLEEIEKFNIRKISDEELSLKINHLKQAISANAIGVIDFLYQQYKERFSGEGLIVKEGFDSKEFESKLNNSEDNIYRILERKLYQKFQNYGLIPPIKSLLSVRADGVKKDNELMRLGHIGFVSHSQTSQNCPVCFEGKLNHTTTCPKNCGFNSSNIMHSNDGIAGYNIAKKGFDNFL